jgi:hypothetical protein
MTICIILGNSINVSNKVWLCHIVNLARLYLWLEVATTPNSHNPVHAGPPCPSPRMLVYGIAIPDQHDDGDSDNNINNNNNNSNNNKEYKDSTNRSKSSPTHPYKHKSEARDNNGEIQYNLVLLHVDLCCIIFTIMQLQDDGPDCSNDVDDADVQQAKRHLISMLLSMIQEYPNETYERLLEDNREPLRAWLAELIALVTNDTTDTVSVGSHAVSDTGGYKNNINYTRSHDRWFQEPSSTPAHLLLQKNPQLVQWIDRAVTSTTIFVSPKLPSSCHQRPSQQRRQQHRRKKHQLSSTTKITRNSNLKPEPIS